MIRIRALTAEDWPQVAEIWAAGLAEGNATFEAAPPTWADFDAGRAPQLRLVAEDESSAGVVLGWAAAGPVSSRPVYAGVAEHSVYVRPDAQGRGVGRALLEALIAAAEATGTWTLRSGVFPENGPSLALHANCGFREVGRQLRVGRHHGRWRDVVVVERRSPTIGDDGPLVRVVLPRPEADLAAARGVLAAAGLGSDDVEQVWRFWVADAEATAGSIVGCAALERYDDTFLLRSVAVVSDRRGVGVGDALVRAALRSADLEVGVRATVCLLTETAGTWFGRFGFAPVPRTALPAAAHRSAQLRGACPTSAQAYLRSR